MALQGQLPYEGSSLLQLTSLTSALAFLVPLRQNKKELEGHVWLLNYLVLNVVFSLRTHWPEQVLICKGFGVAAEHVDSHGAVSAPSVLPTQVSFPERLSGYTCSWCCN